MPCQTRAMLAPTKWRSPISFAASTLLALALTLTTLSAAQSQTLSATRKSSFTYDAAGLLQTETIEPDDAALCVTTAHIYDAWGNRVSSTVQNCAGASGLALFKPRTNTSTFGASPSGALIPHPAGQFATGSANALNHNETRETDPRFGVLTKLTGPNALSTTRSHDDWGRLIKETRADGTQTQRLYCLLDGRGISERTSNSPGCPGANPGEAPAQALRYEQSVATNSAGAAIGPIARTYYDRAGRVLRVVTQAFDDASQPQGSARWVVQDTDYDSLGQVLASTQPYFLDTGSSTPNGANDVGLSARTYDALGRIVALYSRDPQGQAGSRPFGARGNYVAAQTTIAYAGLITTTQNDKSQTRSEETNLEGQIIRITDALGAQLVRQYDAFDNLVQTVDALGN